jgi:hypothetical protein
LSPLSSCHFIDMRSPSAMVALHRLPSY